MHETTITTMSDWTEHEKQFADVLIEIIEGKHQWYEREHKELGATRVPLANISIRPKDFENFPHIMQGIKPYQKPESTAQGMLRLFWEKGELVPAYPLGAYKLSKDGLLYKHLAEKLASTP